MTPADMIHIFCRVFFDLNSSGAPIYSVSIDSSIIPATFTYPPRGKSPMPYSVPLYIFFQPSPKKLKPNKKIIKWAKSKKANILITEDPEEAAKGADAIMTDKPISMGEINVNKKKKKKLLKPYQVNEKIMKLAKDAIFMHCLPASREEVSSKVIYGKKSRVFEQALNRIFVQQAIIQWCLK